MTTGGGWGSRWARVGWGDGHRHFKPAPPGGGGEGGGGVEPTPTVALKLTLEEILAAYVVTPPVQEVDALVATYRQRGADRALDALLECRFTDLFGMGSATASYAGNLMSGLRDLSRQTLPTSKYNRPVAGTQVLISSSPTPDPEYTLTEADQELKIDPPIS
jgi:hypothetical protein